ncbi:MAG: FecR family protein [Bacteroidetes bacterium]|nr:FecR family protein [Bacteroidota bacterium]MDF1863971.1 FecR family protein [Saprospiraceae bacterium]
MDIRKYEMFTVEDFMEEEYFRHWVLENDFETNTFWSKFIQIYPKQSKSIQEAKKMLQSIHGHFESEFNEISKDRAKKSFQNVSKKMTQFTSVVSKRRKMWKWSLAASVLFLIGIGSFFFQSNESTLLTYSTGNGQRMTLFLPDFTEVQLNANSTLFVDAEKWESENVRVVRLEGEGFFDVAKKVEGTKFIVHTGEVDVSVLGTQFNVWARGEKAEVVLEEGKIELAIANQKIAMRPGDFISYSKSKKKIESKKVTPSDYSAWKDGIVVLNDNLSEITKELETIYGVEFTIKNEKLKNRQIQLSAPADSLDQLLEILEVMYSEEINIQKKDGQVILY